MQNTYISVRIKDLDAACQAEDPVAQIGFNKS